MSEDLHYRVQRLEALVQFQAQQLEAAGLHLPSIRVDKGGSLITGEQKGSQQYGFYSARSNSHLCSNCYYDGTNWQRYDTSQAAAVLIVQGPTGVVNVRTAAAGANPITWTGDTQVNYDSGWVAMAPYYLNAFSDWGGWPVSLRRIGNVVYGKGLITRAAAAGATVAILNLPAQFQPVSAAMFRQSASADSGRLHLTPTQLLTYDGITGGNWIALSGALWIVV